MPKPLTSVEFIARATNVHGARYNYNAVVYVNSQQKVTIGCVEHGIFEQTPSAHLRGQGCKQCYLVEKAQQVTTADFITRSVNRHGHRYDYSKSIYIGSSKKIEIVCPTHGSFWQLAGQHMLGQSCAKCYHDGMRKSHDQFIEEVTAVHGTTYDYTNTLYTGFFDVVTITCNTHGPFQQRADLHLRGSGCPQCVSTYTSTVSQAWLESLSIPNLILEFRIPGTKFHADGYDSQTNTIYEFYGDFWHGNIQRYEPTKVNTVLNKTMGELHDRTSQREKTIQSLGYNLVTIWESEWDEIKKNIC